MACFLVVASFLVAFGLLLLWSAAADRYDRMASGRFLEGDDRGDFL